MCARVPGWSQTLFIIISELDGECGEVGWYATFIIVTDCDVDVVYFRDDLTTCYNAVVTEDFFQHVERDSEWCAFHCVVLLAKA